MPKDQHTIDRILLLHPKVRELFTHFVDDIEAGENIVLRLVQGYRTFAEQQVIYNQGRIPVYDESKIVSYSPPGTSYHNFGLAGDFCPIIFDANGKAKDLNWNYNFKKLSVYGMKYGITWGGNFPKPDLDHFENKLGQNWRDFLHLYTIKKFIAGTTYVDI